MEYKTNNIVYSCEYHVVWCPKYRRKVLVGEIAIRLKEIVREIVEEKHGQLLEIAILFQLLAALRWQ